jgi:cytochrome c oxidase cbb3-type subunit 3
MSSRFRTEPVFVAALLLAGCGNSAHQPPPPGAPGGEGMVSVPASGLVPGGGKLPNQPDPRAATYYGSAAAVVNGMRLYKQYNCSGCHFNGGGGIGPPLMDQVWIYGGRLDQIFNTIYQGRPNGMPAWGGKIPEDQMWQIAAYVRSMSLPETLAANQGGTPSQHPAPVPREADMHGGWQLPEAKQAAAKGSSGQGR